METITVPTWDASIATGLAWQDAQHRNLLDVLDRLDRSLAQGGQKQILGQTMAFLRSYCVEHFQAEESRMEASAFPETEAHRNAHEGFLQVVAEFSRRLRHDRSQGGLLLADDLCQELTAWFLGHIRTADRRLAEHLIGCGKGD